ncbi:MAG: DUF4097 family beta strand repeat protein [Chloroflexi bacterium]|nr:DUF4097 family beta strand repeat protein [Chloroflexota bacterium]
MKGKWIVAAVLSLAMLGLCAAMVGTLVFTIGRVGESAFNVRFGGIGLATVSAEATEEQRFAVTGDAVLDVQPGDQSAAGDVTVVAGTGDEIVVSAHKTAWAADTAKAEAALADLKVQISQQGNTVTVRVDRPPIINVNVGQGRPDRVDFTIAVPARTTVTARTRFGNVSLTGTSGDADLGTSFGDVKASGLTAGIIKLDSAFGEVSLSESSAREIAGHTSNGAIMFDSVEAADSVDLSTEFGEITFKDGKAGSLRVNTSSGEVYLSGVSVKQTITVAGSFGGIKLEGATARAYDLVTSSGAIALSGADGTVKAQTQFGDITVSEASAVTLDLNTNSGGIEVSGSLGPGPHRLETQFGGIKLSLPEDTALNIDLSTQFGQIKNEFPTSIDGAPDEKHWRGKINGGGESLTAATDNGNITIQILK